MDVKVIASSHVGHDAEKGKFDEFSGKMLGLCNTEDNLKSLLYEDNAKAIRRSDIAKGEKDRRVFDHESFTLYFEELPKIVTIILDSLKTWTKSEKLSKFSDKYFSKDEELIYNKWIDLFKNKVGKILKDNGKVTTDKMLENIAEDYALNLKSVFSPVTVAYTTTYGEFNRAIGIMENYIAIKKSNDFDNKLSAILIEFFLKMKTLPYYDKTLSKINENISIFDYKEIEEYYGDVYSTKYTCSISGFCELLQNKNLTLKMSMLENKYYIPSIISDNKDLCELWFSDIMTLGNYPMATMVNISDMGTMDNYMDRVKNIKNNILVSEEEIVLKEIYKKYEHSLRIRIHPRVEEFIKIQK